MSSAVSDKNPQYYSGSNYEIPPRCNIPAGAVVSGFDRMVEGVGWMRIAVVSGTCVWMLFVCVNLEDFSMECIVMGHEQSTGHIMKLQQFKSATERH